MQSVYSFELPCEEKFINHSPVTGKRIATFDIRQESSSKRFMPDEVLDSSCSSHICFSDLRTASELSIDESRNEICNIPEQVIYSDVFLSSSDLQVQQKLNFLSTELISVDSSTLSSTDPLDTSKLESEDISKSIEHNDIENLMNDLDSKNNFTESKQVLAEFNEVYAYKDKNRRNRGICSKCGNDRAITFHWKKRDQKCAGCRLKDTNFGICSTCKKNGDFNKKVIMYRLGREDQVCSCCRIKEMSVGVCSRCRQNGDTSIKRINFRNGKSDQLCSNCRKKDTNTGICSICEKYQSINFHNGRPDQMCRNCRLKTRKFAQTIEEIS